MKDEASSSAFSIISVLPPIVIYRRSRVPEVFHPSSFRLILVLLYSMYIRSPNILVKLQLHAHVQTALGNPPGQLL